MCLNQEGLSFLRLSIFLEFYFSCFLSIPFVSGFGGQCLIITLLCCVERGEMNGRHGHRVKRDHLMPHKDIGKHEY